MGYSPDLGGAMDDGLSSYEGTVSSHDLPLSEYRAYGRFYERYWARLFGITVADLEELESFIRREGEAQSLTDLVRAVITSRLDRGPEIRSAPAPVESLPEGDSGGLPAVRMWDPAAAWRVGDHAIVPALTADGNTRPCVGEVVQVGGDHVLISADGLDAPQVYALNGLSDVESAGELPSAVDTLLQAGASLSPDASPHDVSALVDEVLCRFGDSVVGKLLASLNADRRFVPVEGLWFLRELAEVPREMRVVMLARAMFADTAESWTLDELMRLASQRVNGGAQAYLESQPAFRTAERFGWAVALETRSDLFERVSTGFRARWRLAGPPPMRYVARHAVYDPESYGILCMPGDTLPRPTVRRLWETGLLRAALGRDDEAEAVAAADRVADDRPPDIEPDDDERVSEAHFPWPHWLRFGRA